MSAWVEAATGIGTVITAIGGAAGVRALFKRRPKPTDPSVAVTLTESTMAWAKRLEEQAERAVTRADAAERKADEADRIADEARRHAARIEVQLGQVVAYLDLLLRAINDPGMDMETLRGIAASGPPRIT